MPREEIALAVHGHHAFAGGDLSAAGVHARAASGGSSPATASRWPSPSWFRCSFRSRSRRCWPRGFCGTRRTSAPREKKAHGGPLMRWIGGHYIGRPALVPAPPLGGRGRRCSVAWLRWWLLVKLTKFNFMPQDDSSEFEIAFQTPEGIDPAAHHARLRRRLKQRVKAIRDRRPAGRHRHADHHRRNLRARRQGRGQCHPGHDLLPPAGAGRAILDAAGPARRRWSQFEAMGQARRDPGGFPDLRAGVQMTSASAAAAATRTCSSTSSARTWSS